MQELVRNLSYSTELGGKNKLAAEPNVRELRIGDVVGVVGNVVTSSDWRKIG